VAEAYDVERPRQVDGRPWIGLCMVQSIDGSTVVDGRSAQLSSPTDTEVLVTLRRLADAIVVGAGTVRAEGYGVPSKAGQRIGVVTNSGRLDLTTALFTSGAGFLIAPRSLELTGDGADAVEVLRAGDERVDLAEAMRRLPEVVPGAGFVQCEGGGALNGSMLAADLLDELDITTSPLMVGGSGVRLTTGAPDGSTRYDLAQLLVDEEGFLFSRWVRRRAC
jgi:5-amino-6-(5-phosphoribosylamino)uracil reductase